MNNIDLEKELEQLNFDFIQSDKQLFNETIYLVKKKQKRKNAFIISGLIGLTLLFIGICSFILNFITLDKGLVNLILFIGLMFYTSILILIIYLLNIVAYLKQTFHLKY